MSDFLHPEREQGGLLDIARLISQADGLGWEFFERLHGADPSDTKNAALGILRSQRLAQACARLAELDDFKLLLQHLVDTTVLQPVQYVALGLPIDQTALNAARREGENGQTWTILKLIAAGRSVPVGPAKTEKEHEQVSGPVGDGAAKRGNRRRRRPVAG